RRPAKKRAARIRCRAVGLLRSSGFSDSRITEAAVPGGNVQCPEPPQLWSSCRGSKQLAIWLGNPDVRPVLERGKCRWRCFQPFVSAWWAALDSVRPEAGFLKHNAVNYREG